MDSESWYRMKVMQLDRQVKQLHVLHLASQRELDAVRQDRIAAMQQAAALRNEMNQIQQSWGWQLSQRVSRMVPAFARWRQRQTARDADTVAHTGVPGEASACVDVPSAPKLAPTFSRKPFNQEAEASDFAARRPLSLCKVCGLEDFRHPRLRPVIREVFAHEQDRFGAAFPDGVEWRKYWEVAMAVLTFREAGLLREDVKILGVGAGNEPTLFYLTRYVGEVLATDLYENDGGDWVECANRSMLDDPDAHWPFWYRRDRLKVRHMNALALDLPDASVDAIFSSSSIEHFGGAEEINRSVDEMHRVLKPGGVMSLASEFRLDGPSMGVPGLAMFSQADMERMLIGDRDWRLLEAFDDAVSTATLATEQSLAAVHPELHAQYEELGGYWSHHVVFPDYPHIVLKTGEHRFTSFHVALQKAE